MSQRCRSSEQVSSSECRQEQRQRKPAAHEAASSSGGTTSRAAGVLEVGGEQKALSGALGQKQPPAARSQQPAKPEDHDYHAGSRRLARKCAEALLIPATRQSGKHQLTSSHSQRAHGAPRAEAQCGLSAAVTAARQGSAQQCTARKKGGKTEA